MEIGGKSCVVSMLNVVHESPAYRTPPLYDTLTPPACRSIINTLPPARLRAPLALPSRAVSWLRGPARLATSKYGFKVRGTRRPARLSLLTKKHACLVHVHREQWFMHENPSA